MKKTRSSNYDGVVIYDDYDYINLDNGYDDEDDGFDYYDDENYNNHISSFKIVLISFIIGFLAIVLTYTAYTIYNDSMVNDYSTECKLGGKNVTWYDSEEEAIANQIDEFSGSQFISYQKEELYSSLKNITFTFTGKNSGIKEIGSVKWLNSKSSSTLEKLDSGFVLDLSNFQDGETILLEANFKGLLIGETTKYYAFKIKKNALVIKSAEKGQKNTCFYFDETLVDDKTIPVKSLNSVYVRVEKPDGANSADMEVLTKDGTWHTKFDFLFNDNNGWSKDIDFTRFIGKEEIKIRFLINNQKIAEYLISSSD